MKVALVHDWLVGMRGGERCLEVFCELFPDSDIFTLFYAPGQISEIINQRSPKASVLQKLPGVHRYYRHLLPIYPLGMRDLSKAIVKGKYDLVISISHCAAKNLSLPPDLPHICYCLTPVRYLFDQYQSYFQNHPLEPGIRFLAAVLRRWDVSHAASVTKFVAISKFIKERIERYYQRDALVLYPPVRTDWIIPHNGGPGVGFLSVSALVPYKNVHLAVLAFNKLGLPLTVIGRGPEEARLRAIAGPSIKFIPYVSDEELAEYYRKSKALIFAAEEDFGMTPVENQAAGRPVIAWGRGGVLETVVASGEKRTGLFFQDPTVDSLVEAVQHFLEHEEEFSLGACLESARRFSSESFRAKFNHIFSESLDA